MYHDNLPPLPPTQSNPFFWGVEKFRRVIFFIDLNYHGDYFTFKKKKEKIKNRLRRLFLRKGRGLSLLGRRDGSLGRFFGANQFHQFLKKILS